MDAFSFDFDLVIGNLARIGLAFVLVLPLGWHREKSTSSVGLRTFPVVAIAACGFALIGITDLGGDAESRSRVLQGIITGIGFIGAGAVLKRGGTVHGVVTAASVWNAAAIGAAVAFGRVEIAITLSAANFLVLALLTPLESEDKRD